jgi:hypothetical protein
VSDFEQLHELCRRLGASPEQADTMARQLIKRADQLAAERNITPVAAMEHLLKVLIHGRNGEVPPEFQGAKPSENSAEKDRK